MQEREEIFHRNKKLVLCLGAACRAVDRGAIIDVALERPRASPIPLSGLRPRGISATLPSNERDCLHCDGG